MSTSFEIHPFAALFPRFSREELGELSRDIQERGQLESIILYQGLILDGANLYRACQMAGVSPRFEQFEAIPGRRTPEEFVLSRNLRRRHLGPGQRAALALEWSERVELNPETENKRRRGRPSGTLTEGARTIGINEQRVFEIRQIRDADPVLYQEVREGRRNLHSALALTSQRQGKNDP